MFANSHPAKGSLNAALQVRRRSSASVIDVVGPFFINTIVAAG
jgi:hypothetical protein